MSKYESTGKWEIASIGRVQLVGAFLAHYVFDEIAWAGYSENYPEAAELQISAPKFVVHLPALGEMFIAGYKGDKRKTLVLEPVYEGAFGTGDTPGFECAMDKLRARVDQVWAPEPE